MGQVQSIDPRHVGIYKKLLAIQNPATRLQMIDTVLSDPSIVQSAKLTGVYAQLLQVAGAIRHGSDPPLLPGEAIPVQSYKHPQPRQSAGQTPAQLPAQLQHHPQAFQVPSQQTNQIIPSVSSHRSKDPYTQVSKPKRSEKALHFFSACLRVLNIQEEVALTDEMLKASYKKAVIRAHPDKQGGSKEAFDAVTRAYAYLMDILQLIKGRQGRTDAAVPELESVQTQRKSASAEWQMPAEPVKLNPKNLNLSVFNQLFEQTRVPDPDEDGYGDWLKDASDKGSSNKRKGSKKFSEDFNREVFNQMFEEEQTTETGITRFHQPQELMMAPSYGVELGREKPADYTAAPNSDLQFTDLRAAYTKENTVSNQIQGVRIEQRDFHNYKAQREKAPANYNQSELASLAAYEAQQAAKEEARRLRAAQEQLGARDYFERMKQYVITEK
jgi:curved DNA-binding protein CbpA